MDARAVGRAMEATRQACVPAGCQRQRRRATSAAAPSRRVPHRAQAYCRTALLSHPTTQRRLADAAAVLELGSMLPMAAVIPMRAQVAPQPHILAGAWPGAGLPLPQRCP